MSIHLHLRVYVTSRVRFGSDMHCVRPIITWCCCGRVEGVQFVDIRSPSETSLHFRVPIALPLSVDIILVQISTELSIPYFSEKVRKHVDNSRLPPEGDIYPSGLPSVRQSQVAGADERCKSNQEYMVPPTFIGTLRVRCGA